MNKKTVYESILRDVVAPAADVEVDEALWRTWVLHTHSIALRPDLAVDDVRPPAGGQRLVLAPLTRTHVAELMASLWPPNDQRGRDAFWWAAGERVTPYEVLSEVPPELAARAAAARRAVAAHPFVDELIEE